MAGNVWIATVGLGPVWSGRLGRVRYDWYGEAGGVRTGWYGLERTGAGDKRLGKWSAHRIFTYPIYKNMKERPSEKYTLGIDTYRRQMVEIIGGVNDGSTEYEKLTAMEEVERLRLGIRSNERRYRVFVEGKSIEEEAKEVLK